MSNSTAPKQVDILSKKRVFDDFFKIDEFHFKHERFDGTMSAEKTHLCFERGEGVGAVVHIQETDSIILIEQFRISTYEKGPGWMLELPAGMIPAGESPEQTIIREIKEEIGYEVTSVQHVSTFYVSPGGTSERLHVYYASVAFNKDAVGGGLAEEGEDIKAVVLPAEEAFRKIESGEIQDSKTIIGLQWLQLRRAKGSHTASTV